jgi:hypothetical protein
MARHWWTQSSNSEFVSFLGGSLVAMASLMDLSVFSYTLISLSACNEHGDLLFSPFYWRRLVLKCSIPLCCGLGCSQRECLGVSGPGSVERVEAAAISAMDDS